MVSDLPEMMMLPFIVNLAEFALKFHYILAGKNQMRFYSLSSCCFELHLYCTLHTRQCIVVGCLLTRKNVTRVVFYRLYLHEKKNKPIFYGTLFYFFPTQKKMFGRY